MFYYCTVGPYFFILYMIFHLNLRDNNNYILKEYVTWGRTHAHTLHVTKHCKDMLQERFTISMSFCSQFIGVHMCQLLVQYKK